MERINTWTSDFNAGGACYLLEDGSLARGCKVSGAFGGGGVGGRLERKNWDDELIWALIGPTTNDTTTTTSPGCPMATFWCLRELKTSEEAAAAGREPPIDVA